MVYDTIDELKRATRRRDGQYKNAGAVQTPAWYDQMAATTNYIEMAQLSADIEPKSSDWQPYITIRLALDKLKQYPTEIITHECTHAAIFLFRRDVKRSLARIQDQETLCYLVGELSRKVVNKLYEKKLV